jgi:hypothetical protein
LAGYPWEVDIAGDVAYVGAQQFLHVIDISDVRNPRALKEYLMNWDSHGGAARDLKVAGSYLYVACGGAIGLRHQDVYWGATRTPHRLSRIQARVHRKSWMCNHFCRAATPACTNACTNA